MLKEGGNFSNENNHIDETIVDEVLDLPRQKEILQEVPGPIIFESKVSSEYLNEINNFEFLLKNILADIKDGGYDLSDEKERGSLEDALMAISNKFDKKSPRHMRTYLERFPTDMYKDVITDENKETIDMIDDRVSKLYALLGKQWSPELVELSREDIQKALDVAQEITNIVTHNTPIVIKKSTAPYKTETV